MGLPASAPGAGNLWNDAGIRPFSISLTSIVPPPVAMKSRPVRVAEPFSSKGIAATEIPRGLRLPWPRQSLPMIGKLLLGHTQVQTTRYARLAIA